MSLTGQHRLRSGYARIHAVNLAVKCEMCIKSALLQSCSFRVARPRAYEPSRIVVNPLRKSDAFLVFRRR